MSPRGKEAGVFSFVNMSGDGGQSRSGNGFIHSWGGGLGSYRHVYGDLPVALQSRARALAPLPSIAEGDGEFGLSTDTCIMHVNIQGLLSHLAELSAFIRLSKSPPDVVCVNETFLDSSVEDVLLEGFIVV